MVRSFSPLILNKENRYGGAKPMSEPRILPSWPVRSGWNALHSRLLSVLSDVYTMLMRVTHFSQRLCR
jgi:hypothetical protein